MVPLVSVITVCRNSASTIESTIQSVVRQTFSNIEYVLIDGCSTDATIRIVNKYRIHFAQIISESDSGISEAMNKGVSLASGRYLLFLHSDDCFLAQSSLESVSRYLLSGADIVYGPIVFGDRILKPRGFGPWTFVKTPFLHQGAFCRRELFREIGLFDEKLRVCMDYDWFLRAYRAGVTSQYFPFPIVRMGTEGLSSRSDWKSVRSRLEEESVCQSKHVNSIVGRVLYLFWRLPYFIYRRLRSP